MRRDEVAEVLGLLASAFPGSSVTAEMVVTWDDALGLFQAPIVAAAARRWMAEEDRWPTLHQFLGAVEAQARLRDAARALPAPARAEVPVSRERAIGAMRLLRRATAAARDGKPIPHAELMTEVARDGLAVDPESVLYDCPVCLDGYGFVQVRSDPVTLAPCPRCRVEQRVLYDGGHFRRGHTCEVCRPTARGRRAS